MSTATSTAPAPAEGVKPSARDFAATSPATRISAFSVATSGSVPSRYASMMASSCSTAISISSERAVAAASFRSSGIS